MQVEFLISRTGPKTYRVGEKAELPDAEARRLIDAGKARPVAAKPATRRKKAVFGNDDVEVR